MQAISFKAALRAVAFAAVASCAVAAQAATVDFTSLPTGSANAALSPVQLLDLRFDNAALVDDLDAYGSPTGTSHWVATADFGDALISDAGSYSLHGTGTGLDAVYGPVLLTFASARDLLTFSVKQDGGNAGNLQANGSELLFLDQSGHTLSSVQFTQGLNPGYVISSNGQTNLQGVAAVLLPSGKLYSEVNYTAITAVPEPESYTLMLAGLGVMGFLARRHKRA